MKILKFLGLMPLVLALLSTAVMSAGYQYSQGDQKFPKDYLQGEAKPSTEATMLTGSLSSVDVVASQIMLRTQIPGLFGPQEKNVPLTVTNDTTITVCFRMKNNCNGIGSGEEAMKTLYMLNNSGLSSYQNRTYAVTDTGTGNLIHVQIDYNV